MGYAPILQISCRDKNRIAIQGDVLGASGHGCAELPLPDRRLRAGAGDQPGAKPVFDLDCMSLLENHPDHARQFEVPLGPQAHQPAHGVPWGAAINPLRSAP